MRLWLKLLVLVVLATAVHSVISGVLEQQRLWQEISQPNPLLVQIQEQVRIEVEHQTAAVKSDQSDRADGHLARAAVPVSSP